MTAVRVPSLNQLLMPLSSAELQGCVDATHELLSKTQRLIQTDGGLLRHLIGEQPASTAWQHWPADDALDRRTGYRWYYHSHGGRGHISSEHGHFHLFADSAVDDGVTHLVGVSIDAMGLPIRLFSCNRWVTDEQWQDGESVLALIDRFSMRSPRAMGRINAWLASLLAAFRPQIAWVLRRRDLRVQQLLSSRQRCPLEDRRVTILSRLSIDIRKQAIALDQRLGTILE